MAGEPPGGPGGRAVERGLAHDLRNLLTAIDGHAQLARAGLPNGHPAHEDLDEVLAATSRAHQLTEAWLAGPTAIAPPIVPAPLDALVQGFLPLLAAVIGPSVTVDVRYGAPAPARVRISRLRLERVLLNLCLNARDAMPEGGTIVLATELRAADRTAVVSVADAGPGIDAAMVDRLLDPEAPGPVGSGGHGLGLITSRDLLAEAGGRLEVATDSRAGTTMRAVLPLA